MKSVLFLIIHFVPKCLSLTLVLTFRSKLSFIILQMVTSVGLMTASFCHCGQTCQLSSHVNLPPRKHEPFLMSFTSPLTPWCCQLHFDRFSCWLLSFSLSLSLGDQSDQRLFLLKNIWLNESKVLQTWKVCPLVIRVCLTWRRLCVRRCNPVCDKLAKEVKMDDCTH